MGPLPLPPALDRDASLFLDLDGTLVDFAPTPDAIEVGEDLRGLLAHLAGWLGGRLAVISGRALDDLTGHLGIPDLPAAGSHGLERRDAEGRFVAVEPGADVAVAIGEAVSFADAHGLVAEPKPLGVAIHFRAHPEAGQAVGATLSDLAKRHGLVVQHGAMVGELRVPGPDKGDVIRGFMAEPPFADGRPIMVGDDLTDEAAFAAVNGLGGTAILVGPPRKTHASFGLPTVRSVREWLGGAA